MSDDFIDSNIIIYMLDEVDDRKRQIADRLVGEGLRRRTASISFQVVQEVLNVITRKIQVPASADEARDILSSVLMPMWDVMPSETLYRRALTIQDRYRYSFYDALIVAAALEAGAIRLYSEDLQHGQTIESLRIENPFATV